MPADGHASADGPEARGKEIGFELCAGRTAIGAGADRDIVLEGLADDHAVIDWWPKGDEFVFTPLTAPGSATIDGEIATTGLHHGDRLQLGPWTLVFRRDEDADHIRTGRARQGGESAGPVGARFRGHETEFEATT